jgi:hypothetical protein
VLPQDIALDAMHQAQINAIRNRKGAEFDQAYRMDQVQAHQQTLAILDTYATVGSNPALKAWAAKAVPMVRKHLGICRLWEWAAGHAKDARPQSGRARCVTAAAEAAKYADHELRGECPAAIVPLHKKHTGVKSAAAARAFRR